MRCVKCGAENPAGKRFCGGPAGKSMRAMRRGQFAREEVCDCGITLDQGHVTQCSLGIRGARIAGGRHKSADGDARLLVRRCGIREARYGFHQDRTP